MAGKGSAPRNCFSRQFKNNYETVFGSSKARKTRKTKAWQRKPVWRAPKINKAGF